jgi:hypothetical protein
MPVAADGCSDCSDGQSMSPTSTSPNRGKVCPLSESPAGDGGAFYVDRSAGNYFRVGYEGSLSATEGSTANLSVRKVGE